MFEDVVRDARTNARRPQRLAHLESTSARMRDSVYGHLNDVSGFRRDLAVAFRDPTEARFKAIVDRYQLPGRYAMRDLAWSQTLWSGRFVRTPTLRALPRAHPGLEENELEDRAAWREKGYELVPPMLRNPKHRRQSAAYLLRYLHGEKPQAIALVSRRSISTIYEALGVWLRRCGYR